MARQLNMDTQQQNFWKEEYLRETKLCVVWHQKYGTSVKTKQEQNREQLQKPMDNTLHLPSVQAPLLVKPSIPPLSQPPMELMKDLTVFDVEMRPAPREVCSLLYQGVSHEDGGRHHYLKTHQLTPPEEKYTFPVTTDFNYGWQIGKMAHEHVTPSPKRRPENFFHKDGVFSLLHPHDGAFD